MRKTVNLNFDEAQAFASREMMAQWTTLNRSIAGVRWGTQPGRYRRSALSEIKTYSREEMCGAPASTIGWLDPGIFHSALMDGLQPSTRYYYTVGDLVSAVLACRSHAGPKKPLDAKLDCFTFYVLVTKSKTNHETASHTRSWRDLVSRSGCTEIRGHSADVRRTLDSPKSSASSLLRRSAQRHRSSSSRSRTSVRRKLTVRWSPLRCSPRSTRRSGSRRRRRTSTFSFTLATSRTREASGRSGTRTSLFAFKLP